MSPRALLRVALGGLVFFAFGHTMGMLDTTSRGPVEAAALGALRAFKFDVMGVQRSHMQFYDGFGWYLTVTLVMLTGMVWQLSRLVEAHPGLVRSLLVGPILFSVASVGLCVGWFFPAPLVASLVVLVGLAGAWWKLG